MRYATHKKCECQMSIRNKHTTKHRLLDHAKQTSIDKGIATFHRQIFQNGAFYIVQLQTIYLLNLLCNVLFMYNTLAMAAFLLCISGQTK